MYEDQKLGIHPVPIISTAVANCLTALNWHQVNISNCCYYLESLLIKPGLATLFNISNLKRYFGWGEKAILIVNAASLQKTLTKQNNCEIRSPYDGGKIKLDSDLLIKLLNHLAPECVILPEFLSADVDDLSATIFPFIPKYTIPLKRKYGRYYEYAEGEVAACLRVLTGLQESLAPLYISGNFSFPELQMFSQARQLTYLESNRPALDASRGLVYNRVKILDLKEEKFREDYLLIAKDCPCPPCKQHFTRAYLHHLFTNVPLLCQRLLLQHNIYQYFNFCRVSSLI